MRTPPLLGPVALCTIVANDGNGACAAYTRWMHQSVVEHGALDHDTAAALGLGTLAGNPSWLLANATGRAWLLIVEAPAARERDPLHSFGWMAMEVLVADVDDLAARLPGSPFSLLRPPADLDVSDNIRACQVRGPTGEILYLTQINGEVAPFDLPRCEAAVDHLFIPVLSTPSRDSSLADYAAISGNEGLRFDTRITVVNQARAFELTQRHPVATLQLAGQALIEIDQIAGTRDAGAGLHTGVANIAFYCQLAADAAAHSHTSGPFAGYRTSARAGSGGEDFTLVHL